MADVAGWTPVAEATGWTPVAERPPDFKSGVVGDTSQLDTLDKLLGLLPMAGGTAGGIIGGIGGTVAGFGVGGVPGAVGGAAVGGSLGEALRQLAEMVRGRPVPTSSDVATGIGKEGGMQALMELGGQGITKGAAAGAKAVYRGYLKPALSARMLPKAGEIVDTAIREALPISNGGGQTAQRVINDLRTEVDSIIAKTPGKIDLQQIADKVRAFAKQRYFKPGVDSADFDAAMKVADKIDQHPSIQNPFAPNSPAPVGLPAANEAKRGLYTSIKETGFGVQSGAKKSTEKFAANQLKTGLEAAAPAIAPLNARESKLIDAAKAISRAVEREANQNPIYGMKTLASTAIGGEEYARKGDPTTAAATALAVRVGLHPAVASRMAIVASRLSKQLGVSAAVAARLAYYGMSETEQKP